MRVFFSPESHIFGWSSFRATAEHWLELLVIDSGETDTEKTGTSAVTSCGF